MSELRDFVADLLEHRGAAIEALGSDRLEVLAPAPLQRQLGWPELSHLSFGTQQAPGTIATVSYTHLTLPTTPYV